MYVARADHFGRTTPDAILREFPAGQWLENRFESVKKTKPKIKPIINGDEILQLGFPHGKLIGEILRFAVSLQTKKLHITKEEVIVQIKSKFKLYRKK